MSTALQAWCNCQLSNQPFPFPAFPSLCSHISPVAPVLLSLQRQMGITLPKSPPCCSVIAAQRARVSHPCWFWMSFRYIHHIQQSWLSECLQSALLSRLSPVPSAAASPLSETLVHQSPLLHHRPSALLLAADPYISGWASSTLAPPNCSHLRPNPSGETLKTTPGTQFMGHTTTSPKGTMPVGRHQTDPSRASHCPGQSRLI